MISEPTATLHVTGTFRTTSTSTFGSDATFNGGAGAVTVAAASDIRIAGGTWTGEYTGGIKIQSDGSNSYIQHKGTLFFRDEGSTNNFQLTQSGGLTITGAVTANGGFSGSGASLTSLNASNLSSGTVASGRIGSATVPSPTSGISIMGNFGQWQTHGQYQNFNTDVSYWGWNFMNNNTNAPNTASGQWYRGRFSLGTGYGIGTASNSYWMEMTIPRYNHTTSGQMYVRTCENGSIGSWTEVGSRPRNSVIPYANNTIDLGSSSVRWRNIYTNDLNLSNEGGANDVDGTWGNFTIQEGEDDLFLINKRNGKKYKFNLTEVQ